MRKNYWARAPQPRRQIVLFQSTLDDVVSADHPVRIFAELLDDYDWSEWEAGYDGTRGQPPIHPRILAALWLYGIRRGVRSSRKLEYMAGWNLDFMWLAEGHRPDHTTLSEFRTRFKEELKGLFRKVMRIALAAGLARLAGVASDGTHIQANANRFDTWTQEKAEAYLAQLEAEFQQRLATIDAARRADDALPEPHSGELFEELGGDSENQQLPPELLDQQARIEHLRDIKQRLEMADKVRAKDGIDPLKNPAQIPMHDTDSKIMPNKEGGYAPNYTPIATTESHGGFIVDATVTSEISDSQTLVPSLDRIEAEHGEYPELALADGAYASGPNIRALEERGVEFLSHITEPEPATNPAVRPDPTAPVPESLWIELPISKQSQTLDKACFVYDEAQDIYWCPLGQALTYECTKTEQKNGRRHEWRVFRCASCEGCPLREKCVAKTNQSGRTVTRDVYATDRERLAKQMREPGQKERYDQRMKIAETPFALIKDVIGLRQFLLRGLEKVNTEWRWTCLAVNLDKLVRGLLRLRHEFAQQAS